MQGSLESTVIMDHLSICSLSFWLFHLALQSTSVPLIGYFGCAVCPLVALHHSAREAARPSLTPAPPWSLALPRRWRPSTRPLAPSLWPRERWEWSDKKSGCLSVPAERKKGGWVEHSFCVISWFVVEFANLKNSVPVLLCNYVVQVRLQWVIIRTNYPTITFCSFLLLFALDLLLQRSKCCSSDFFV